MYVVCVDQISGTSAEISEISVGVTHFADDRTMNYFGVKFVRQLNVAMVMILSGVYS